MSQNPEKRRNCNSGSVKTKIFIDKVPFTLPMLVGVMHNSTTAKQPKSDQVMPSKMSVKGSFVTPIMKKMGKEVEDFLVLPTIIV